MSDNQDTCSESLKKEMTEDGSLTLRDSETGELFHNRAGALTEAFHNYLLPSRVLDLIAERKNVRILDVCFGLGYNSFVVMHQALEKALRGQVEIVAIEKDASVLSVCRQVLDNPRLDLLRRLIQADWGQPAIHIEHSGTSIDLSIKVDDFRRVITNLEVDFDLVFHDPFSPKRCPQLWTIDIFRHYERLLAARKGAVFTYSSAVAVRSALRMCGFEVRRTAAVGGKSGGTAGLLNALYYSKEYDCLPLSEEEELRLKSISAIPYRDTTLEGDAKRVFKLRQEELMCAGKNKLSAAKAD